MFRERPGNALRGRGGLVTMMPLISAPCTVAGRFTWLPTLRLASSCAVALLALIAASWTALRAGTLDAVQNFRLDNGRAIVEFADRPGEYFLLEESLDFQTWKPADMSLGQPSDLELDPNAPRRYFRVVPLSQFAPLDTDSDGMDDLYELSHSELDPLDPTDGSKLTPDGSGRTNYQNYLLLFGIDSYKILKREGREVSIFNFGAPTAAFEANSRAQSIFNFGDPGPAFEANSREISLYNGDAMPTSDLVQVEGREVSVFNIGEAAPGPGGMPAVAEAISREVSLFNGDAVPVSDLLQTHSREFSVFNIGVPTAAIEAISREVSVLNFTEP